MTSRVKPAPEASKSVKVFLSVPMVANRELGRAKLMATVVRKSGNTLVSPWVLESLKTADRGVNAFVRDKGGAESCDVLVADVSQPSLGVGMEIMAAYKARRRIILVAKGGRIASRMLDQMDHKEVVSFETDEDLAAGLAKALSI